MNDKKNKRMCFQEHIIVENMEAMLDNKIVGVPSEQAPYISPTPGEIPIIASSAYSPFLVTKNNPEALNKEMLQEVKDCGFNVFL